ncbi:Glutathione S-transferase-like protein ustS [Hypsizygus marmoreus]|uniref:Glutathione S-transferase-like protein ustS n=1 Tax=Hypsizygus marmoreus TaxID=39966 RepID=A0A369J696_HYPMA|nr:Glutathione S-transferase-like protein ustS [Hypsizygus marmoreus]
MDGGSSNDDILTGARCSDPIIKNRMRHCPIYMSLPPATKMRAFVRHLRPASKPKQMSTKTQSLITLFDIPTAKGAETWSPNVWRIRMALNYKRLPYQTQWVEYPDIGKVGQEIGAKPTTPNPDGSGTLLWTCPMIIDPNHIDSDGKPTVISDSIVIAKYLDEVYPERKVIPEGTDALYNVWSQFIGQNITGKLASLLVPLCPNVLSERGKEYFITTREKWWGPLDKMCPDREKGWAGVQEGLNKVAAALDANGEGDEKRLRVIPGREWYADFTLIAPLLWASTIVDKKELEALRGWNDGRWGKILDSHAEVLRIE